MVSKQFSTNCNSGFFHAEAERRQICQPHLGGLKFLGSAPGKFAGCDQAGQLFPVMAREITMIGKPGTHFEKALP